MKFQVSGEVIEIQERESKKGDQGRIFKVLHSTGAGKEVIDIWHNKHDKKGNLNPGLPDVKVGGIYKGTVQFNGLVFAAQ